MSEILSAITENHFVYTVLCGICDRHDNESEESLDELERLCDTAGATVIARLLQQKDTPDSATYIGKGKVEELRELCINHGVELVVFDSTLTPSQIRNLEEAIGDVRVIDRNMLILDIFALHAVTMEGKLQVELAQLEYTMPRIYGHGTELSKLGGGIGTRGPGETKLETDKRHLRRRIDSLKEQLKEIEKNREVQRKQRERSGILKIAIAGYTNAGKSTLLNRLTDAGILAMDKLFATLDPTTRKYTLPSGTEILLTDTVGFIHKLPHHLVEAFKSTLEEVKYADAILVVSDVSDPNCHKQLAVTQELLSKLGGNEKTILYLFNKWDLNKDGVLGRFAVDNAIYISAKTGEGIDVLIDRLEKLAAEKEVFETFEIPLAKQWLVSYLYNNAKVDSIEYSETGAIVAVHGESKVIGYIRSQLEK